MRWVWEANLTIVAGLVIAMNIVRYQSETATIAAWRRDAVNTNKVGQAWITWIYYWHH